MVQGLWYSPHTQEVEGSNLTDHNIFFSAIIPRNIPKYISNNLFRNFSSYITSGHLHSEVYFGKSADFYDSVGSVGESQLQTGRGLVADWMRVSCRLDKGQQQTGRGLVADWMRVSCRLDKGQQQTGRGLSADWTRVSNRLDVVQQQIAL